MIGTCIAPRGCNPETTNAWNGTACLSPRMHLPGAVVYMLATYIGYHLLQVPSRVHSLAVRFAWRCFFQFRSQEWCWLCKVPQEAVQTP